jgi:hypothetical protein
MECDIYIIVIYIYRTYLHVEIMKKNLIKTLNEMWKKLGVGNIFSIFNFEIILL